MQCVIGWSMRHVINAGIELTSNYIRALIEVCRFAPGCTVNRPYVYSVTWLLNRKHWNSRTSKEWYTLPTCVNSHGFHAYSESRPTIIFRWNIRCRFYLMPWAPYSGLKFSMNIQTNFLCSFTGHDVISYFRSAENWIRILALSAKIMPLTCLMVLSLRWSWARP